MDILEIPFVGAYELRKSLPLLLEKLERKKEGMIITRKGKPAAMLLSLKKYQEMKLLNEELEEAIRELADKDYLRELFVAKKEIQAGKSKRAEKVFKELGI